MTMGADTMLPMRSPGKWSSRPVLTALIVTAMIAGVLARSWRQAPFSIISEGIGRKVA